MPEHTCKTIPICDLPAGQLRTLSENMKLSLTLEDMLVIQEHFKRLSREPTDVELEVIAQTWSEHCKHRTFNARIQHESDGKQETINSLFQTYIQQVSEDICKLKPDFVLSAFHDNAGFIKLDEKMAVCLKVETHNHPSAIEPYAGANTGLGGVIRDILGAGKGARPIASLDVFCFGPPDLPPDSLSGDAIHPLGIFRGVVRGVRDYGNRMGIPTVAGAIIFDKGYTYNPLVYCGTAGVLPIAEIPKKVLPGMEIILAGGRTGRDGLHGATFSSAVLDTNSHETDRGAVQIGNPIEEKKVCDFVLQARAEGLIEFITDCGAGGISSAAGEMVSETGGKIYLEKVPLKEPGLSSWEILLSESQERMVLAIDQKNRARIIELARIYETEVALIGEITDSHLLEVYHHGQQVCALNEEFLHCAPHKFFTSKYQSSPRKQVDNSESMSSRLRRLLHDVNLASREPVIREYDHEVQGNTIIKPLAGVGADCPQDGAVLKVDGSTKYIALGVALQPQYDGNPFQMGHRTVDEAMRQLVVTGVDPDKIALLDNFCAGDPSNPEDLGKLVECVKGMAAAARDFSAPFISGKDSFYNSFDTKDGPQSIPVTLLVSAIGIIDEGDWITGASIRSDNSRLCLIRAKKSALETYRKVHTAIKNGWILSAHDVSDGGVAVALAEMGFSLKAGIDVKYPAAELFDEPSGLILIEIPPAKLNYMRDHFERDEFMVIGKTTTRHKQLKIKAGLNVIINEPLDELKQLWKTGLQQYY